MVYRNVFIEYLSGSKLIICLLLWSNVSFAQQIIIADTPADSLFCVLHYPYYNKDTNMYITGLHFPQRIEGKNCSIDTIYKRINNKLVSMYHDKVEKGYYLFTFVFRDTTDLWK